MTPTPRRARPLRRLSILALGWALLMAVAGPAAASVCVTGNVSYTLTQGTVDPVWASLCDRGNDMHWNADSMLFGLAGWAVAHKVDDPLAARPRTDMAGGDAPRLATAPSGDGTLSWGVENAAGYNDLILVLKQGPTFGAFRLNPDGPLWGRWGTTGPGQGALNDLSHATLWFRPDGPTSGPTSACGSLAQTGLMTVAGGCLDQTTPGAEVAVVPLPAAGLMMLAALGLLGGLGLRRARRA